MSRSKRAPVYTEGYGSKDKKRRKRHANRAVRDSDEVASGSSYKKVSNSWDITDYKFRADKSDSKVRRK
jgi:hypothetical protein